LLEHNPKINWQTYTLNLSRCPDTCQNQQGPISVQEEEHPAIIAVRAHGNKSIELAEKAVQGQKKKTLEEMVPREYWKYQRIFEKKASECFPIKHPWDNAIELKEGWKP
ncbi:hypothetical protein JAAARDRAFT_110230, partial [Jaapia argillacea MUCL 33604]